MTADTSPLSTTKPKILTKQTKQLQETENPSLGLFLDFVTLVVPKVETESARWKYDVRKEVKTLTVYKLMYKDRISHVSDCLHLQFHAEPSDSSAYSFIPTFSSCGQVVDASFISQLLGKPVLTSPLDLQILLDHRDDADENSNCHDKKTNEAIPSPSVQPDCFENFTEPLESLEDEETLHTKRVTTIRKKRKRTSDNISDTEASARKNADEGQNDDNTFFLPLHPTSGGTVFSSQYWLKAEEGRERLTYSKDVFVESHILTSLSTLILATSEEERLAQSTQYGWLLLEHLLGGRVAIARSFAYSSSATCPISEQELLDHVEAVLDAVLGMHYYFCRVLSSIFLYQILRRLFSTLFAPFYYGYSYWKKAVFKLRFELGTGFTQQLILPSFYGQLTEFRERPIRSAPSTAFFYTYLFDFGFRAHAAVVFSGWNRRPPQRNSGFTEIKHGIFLQASSQNRHHFSTTFRHVPP